MTLTRSEQAKTGRAEQDGPPPEEEPPWLTVVAPGEPVDNEPAPPSGRRVLAMMLLGAALISILVAISGSVAASRLAEKESVNDAAKAAAVLADAVVQPALTDGLVTGDPKSFAAMDRAVRRHVLGPSSVRVKIWTASGRVVYSDEPRLVGRVYPLGAEERSVFTTPVTRAEVSDLKAPENTYERGQGRLLEVYRPVWTPSGEPLLFETYAKYDGVTSRATQLWRGFAGITISSLLALVVLMMPVVWGLLSRIRRAQDQRERHATRIEGARMRRAEEQRVAGEFAARGDFEVVALPRPRRVGRPSARQFETHFNGAGHRRIAVGEEQRRAGEHFAFVRVVPHFLATRGPGVLVVLESHAVLQVQALLAFHPEIPVLQRLQRHLASRRVAHLQAFDEIRLPVRQAVDGHDVEHRQHVAGLPEVGVDVGEAMRRVQAHVVTSGAPIAVGGMRERCETGDDEDEQDPEGSGHGRHACRTLEAGIHPPLHALHALTLR